jgi:hypothetical protein
VTIVALCYDDVMSLDKSQLSELLDRGVWPDMLSYTLAIVGEFRGISPLEGTQRPKVEPLHTESGALPMRIVLP